MITNLTIHGLAAYKPGQKLKKFSYQAAPGKNDVVIKVKYCALGTPDTYFIDDFWNETQYPFVPGYEIIGIVESVGKNIKGLKINDRVGIGYQVNSCGKCQYCLSGKENICQHAEFIGINHQGGLADKIVINHRFAFKIPVGLNSAKTAPLMCSALTPFAAIKNAKVKPEMQTGVIGIGGLGHLAVKVLDKMACQVTAFSSDQSKRQKNTLGFDDFVLNTQSENFADLVGKYDFLISTVPEEIDWKQYLKLLKPNGILSIIGLPRHEIHFPATSLADYGEKTIKGGFIGNRSDIKEVLRFAAKNNVEAEIEQFPISKANEALDKIRRKKVHFKAVIKI